MSEDSVEREVLHREFPAELEASGDGRTIDVRIVPFNIAQRVLDPPHLGGTGHPYDEMWLSGAFDKQINAAHRVLANFEHEQGIGGIVARGQELRDTGEALEGAFRVLNGPDGDKMLELVENKHVTGVSLEAHALRSVKEDGIVKRVKAHLHNIAFCRRPAFPQAEVLAVRMEQELPPATLELSTDLSERLERIGFEPLIRRAIVRGRWDGSAARYDDDQWKRACLLDRGPSHDTAKTRYGLPVLEPNGDLNVNGMHAAAQRFSQVQGAGKPAAARKLVRFYRQAGEEPPPVVLSAAAR